MASYPNSIASLTNPTASNTLNSPSHSAQHTTINAEVTAIETELGLVPKGTYANVATRLSGMPLVVMQTIYYVGSLFCETTGVNPATTWGFGTWVQYAVGQALVGVDITQTEFNTVGKTGGEKTHTLIAAEVPNLSGIIAGGQPSGGNSGFTYNPASSPGLNNSGFTQVAFSTNSGGSGAHNNLSPYITCYVWKRTA